MGKKQSKPDQELRLLKFMAAVLEETHHHAIYGGIDPGADGAIGLICGHLRTVLDIPAFKVKRGKNKTKTVFDLPAILSLFDCFTNCVGRLPRPVIFCVEEPPPSMGAGKGSAYGQFRLGCAFAMWPLFLMSRGFKVRVVSPSVWKRKMALSPDKRKSLDKARKLFPSPLLKRVMDHNRAESILLAAYCRHTTV